VHRDIWQIIKSMPEFIDLGMGEHRKSENIFIPMQPASILREMMHREMNYSENPMRIRIREDFRVGTVGTGSLASGTSHGETSHGDRFCGSGGMSHNE